MIATVGRVRTRHRNGDQYPPPPFAGISAPSFHPVTTFQLPGSTLPRLVQNLLYERPPCHALYDRIVRRTHHRSDLRINREKATPGATSLAHARSYAPADLTIPSMHLRTVPVLSGEQKVERDFRSQVPRPGLLFPSPNAAFIASELSVRICCLFASS